MDYAVLPPEVNSGRMYAGAGSAPLVAAAAAWDRLAGELGSAASSYRSVVFELADEAWQGPASASMMAAAEPYVDWMSTTSAQAAQAAGQARAAAAAYEQAYAATVPPPMIAANRQMLVSLVAHNVFGQNAPAIAATQAQYHEMWAQDAAAMYGYAGDSAAATVLAPFAEPVQNTNPAGAANQAAAVGQMAASSATSSTVPGVLQSLASPASGTGPIQGLIDVLNTNIVSTLNTISDNWGVNATLLAGGVIGWGGASQIVFLQAFLGPAGAGAAAAAAVATSTVSSTSVLPEGAVASVLAGSYGSGAGLPAAAAGLGGAPVSAGVGSAAPVGGLSVPPSWGAAAPEIRLAGSAIPTAGAGALAAGPASSGGWFGGMPMVGSMVNAPNSGDPRPRYAVKPTAKAGQPGGPSGALDQRGQSDGQVSAAAGGLTEREREELNALREEATDLVMERDAMSRLILEATRS